MSNKESQCKAILKHLKDGYKITQLDALRKFGCMRLGARIYDLKQRGIPVVKEMIKRGSKSFAQYYIQEVV